MATGLSDPLAAMSADPAKRALREKLRQQHGELFVDRIYLTCNQTHPGMGLEQEAMIYISDVLIRMLAEILYQKPESKTDLLEKVRSTFPSALESFRHDRNEIRTLMSKGRSKEAKTLATAFHRLQDILKSHNPHRLDDATVIELLTICEYVLYLILNWSGTYVNKMLDGDRTISLQALRTAMNADRDLSDLVDTLYEGEEQQAGPSFYPPPHRIIPGSPPMQRAHKQSDANQYEKICKTFCKDEKSFIEDVSTIVNVFKRKLEEGIGKDALAKKQLSSIFGNIAEIYELAIKIHRTIDDGLEMSDPPAIGAGFIELAEGMEFEAFVIFTDVLQEPVNAKLISLINDPKNKAFFNTEDRTYSASPTGQTFRMAVKYVLPALLYSVIAHFYSYLRYIKLLQKHSASEIDREDLYNTEVLLLQVSKNLPALSNMEKMGHRFKKETSYPVGIIPQIQKSIDGYTGKSIAAQCYAFVREGDLHKVRNSQTLAENLLRSRNAAERHIFLFDNLMVVCKTVKDSCYKYKDQFDIRKADIFDLPDEDEVRNAFRVRAAGKGTERREITLFCHTPEERDDWMTSLVEWQTASILHRMRDSYQKEEEKRIPLMLPTPMEYQYAEPDMDENIVFEDYTHNSGIPVVRSGTVFKLVERLTYPHYVDSEFVKTFMTTYRSFMPPGLLLDHLIERFSIPIPQAFAHLDQQVASPPPITAPKPGGPLAGRYDTIQSHGWQSQAHNASQAVTPTNLEQAFHRFREEYQKPIQHKVMQIMNHWVRYHAYDFVDPELLAKFKQFLHGHVVKLSNNHKKWSAKILDALEKKSHEYNPNALPDMEIPRDNSFTADFPETLWHTAAKGDIGAYDLLTLHPVEIGRQVTLLHFHLYRAIKPIELVDAAWTKQDEKYKKSPQLLKLIDHSTKLTYWVAKAIVETQSIEERVELFSRVLEIMCVFEELNNFNGVVAFYSALNCSSVFRLKDSHARLDKEKQAWYNRFQKLCDPHWKEMLQRLRSINPPCVPFAGTYLSQIFFFKTGRSTYHEGDNDLVSENEVPHRKLVSFMKCRKIASVIREIQMYQNQPYMIKVEDSIRKFFEDIDPLAGFADKDEFETYLYNKSKELEPREPGSPNENVRPTHTPEDLKSPGIKPHKNSTSSSHFQRSRSHNAYHAHTMPAPFPTKGSAKSTVASPTSKSPPATLAHAAPGSEDSHFAIVDISPGHQPRWVGDAGRINQAFTSEYMTPQLPPPHSAGFSSASSPTNGPKSPNSNSMSMTPASHSGSASSRRLPPAPLSSHETRFAFPPLPSNTGSAKSSRASLANDTSATFTLSQPPSRRREAHTGTLPIRKPPAPTPSSPPLPIPPKWKNDDQEDEAPAIPPRQAPQYLPHPLPTDTLTQLMESRSPSPRSPTVSLMVPLPSSARSEPSPASTDEATVPPRPPKPSSLSRNASQAPADEPALKAPPLPPKPTPRAQSTEQRPTNGQVFDAPPLPPKPRR